MRGVVFVGYFFNVNGFLLQLSSLHQNNILRLIIVLLCSSLGSSFSLRKISCPFHYEITNYYTNCFQCNHIRKHSCMNGTPLTQEVPFIVKSGSGCTDFSLGKLETTLPAFSLVAVAIILVRCEMNLIVYPVISFFAHHTLKQ